MAEFIGVKPVTDVAKFPFLKREVLLFDRIAIPSLDTCTGFIKQWLGPYSKPFIDEINWLIEQKILFEPISFVDDRTREQLENDPMYAEASEGLKIYRAKLKQAEKPLRIKFEVAWKAGEKSYECKQHEMDNYLDRLAEMNWYLARMLAVQLRVEDHMDAHPCSSEQIIPEATIAHKSEVIQITLNAFPMPSSLTPWEQIFEFRSDPDSQSKFLALRNWMSEVARDNLSPIEIEQKLEYLIDQYRRHIEFHKMKVNRGVIETVVVSTAELLEDLVKIKWGALAKGLFSFKERRLSLLESELTSPGNEVAYIVKAEESLAK